MTLECLSLYLCLPPSVCVCLSLLLSAHIILVVVNIRGCYHRITGSIAGDETRNISENSTLTPSKTALKVTIFSQKCLLFKYRRMEKQPTYPIPSKTRIKMHIFKVIWTISCSAFCMDFVYTLSSPRLCCMHIRNGRRATSSSRLR